MVLKRKIIMVKTSSDKLFDIFKENKVLDVKSIGNLFTIYLSGQIESPENYTACFDSIRNADEDDIIRIHINSPGGDLFTTIQFIRVMTECKGTVICSAEGACMSAATMIFLCADMYEISEHCLFMFHNYSGGTFGKGGEMYDQLINERKWSEKIIHKMYGGFLTDAEISSILENKDIWMEGEEVMRRLEKRIKDNQQPPSAKKSTRKKSTTKKA
jgi:ATP-dependent protease ClpP protease subunit